MAGKYGEVSGLALSGAYKNYYAHKQGKARSQYNSWQWTVIGWLFQLVGVLLLIGATWKGLEYALHMFVW